MTVIDAGTAMASTIVTTVTAITRTSAGTYARVNCVG